MPIKNYRTWRKYCGLAKAQGLPVTNYDGHKFAITPFTAAY